MTDVHRALSAGLASFGDSRAVSVRKGAAQAFFTGVRSPLFNGIHVWACDERLDASVRELVKDGTERSLPMTLFFPAGSSCGDPLSALASELGFEETGDPQPLMVLEGVEPPEARIEPGLVLSSPENREDRDAIAELTADVFGLPPSIAALIAAHGGGRSDVEWTTLARDGLLVAMAMFVDVGDTAVVFNVGVTQSQRRLGLGAEVTWAAIRQARARGLHRSVLLASPLGEPVYASMGFQTAGSVRVLARKSHTDRPIPLT